MPATRYIDGLVLLEGGGAGAGSADEAERSPSTRRRWRRSRRTAGRTCSSTSLLGFIQLLPLGQVGRGRLARRLPPAGRAGALAAHDDLRLGRGLLAARRARHESRRLRPLPRRRLLELRRLPRLARLQRRRRQRPARRCSARPSTRRSPNGALRTWKEFDDPTLPTCPPNVEDVSPGCALLDNGPPSGSGRPGRRAAASTAPSARSPRSTASRMTQFGKLNGFEWYFAAGRPNLDFSYGRDSSALVAEHWRSIRATRARSC